jgi:flagellar hook protein FlgE
VSVATISQQFTQGNLNITGNNLDVAINGGGFFQVTKTNGSTAYTRDGQFKLDKDGNLLTNTGAFLMGYPTDTTGAATSITPGKLTLPTGAPIPAKPTSLITAEFNLDARAPIALATTSPAQYGTSISTYDSQGVAIPVSLYFVKSDVDTWNVYDSLATAQTDLTTLAAPATPPVAFGAGASMFQMTFSTSGAMVTPAAAQPINITSPNPNIGTFVANVDVSSVTQFGTNFAVTNLQQDGYTSGEFTSLNIDGKGVISTSYSNGQTLKTGGMIALADFRNLQGLAPIGGGEYLETYKSGPVVLGQPGIGKYGELRAGAVEESNVDLTSELVNMMTAQRNYQANAQTIKTQDQIMSTLVNLR